MRIKANLLYKPGNFQMDDCQIEKVVELTYEEFCELKITPGVDQAFIVENKSYMFNKDGIIHCLLALSQTSHDGVLIDAEGYNYPRYGAYIPGMRDIVNAEMDRAADYIIRQGIENTDTGSWRLSFEELREPLGLTVRVGCGLDSMLRAALKRRPEVAAVDMHDGCIEMEYHPEYCQRLNRSLEDQQPELRLKDILPLLKGSGLMFLCHEEAEQAVLVENLQRPTGSGREEHAALLNARVSEICETPEGTEILLTGIAPEELRRFNEAYDAFIQAEQAMGPAMQQTYGGP